MYIFKAKRDLSSLGKKNVKNSSLGKLPFVPADSSICARRHGQTASGHVNIADARDGGS